MSKTAKIAAWEAYPDDRFVDVEYSSMCRGFYQEGYEQAEKDLDNCDWNTFRREAAKQMLPITSNWKLTKADCTASIPIRKEAACKLAIEYADELIKQLKEEQK